MMVLKRKQFSMSLIQNLIINDTAFQYQYFTDQLTRQHQNYLAVEILAIRWHTAQKTLFFQNTQKTTC